MSILCDCCGAVYPIELLVWLSGRMYGLYQPAVVISKGSVFQQLEEESRAAASKPRFTCNLAIDDDDDDDE